MDSPFLDTKIIDCHIHYPHPDLSSNLIKILDRNRITSCNIVCTPHYNRLSLVPDALQLKANFPERVYVFGGLDISALFMQPETCGQYFAEYAEKLAEMGCDGIKMIEGKPDMRRNLPTPDFDSRSYEPYWAKIEEMGFPLVFHVNDPEEFWDKQRIPDWALKQGWFYGDGSFINNEAQYSQVINVLTRFPKLKIIFAHFFFLSSQLERLAGYLDRFPNMHVDLTPGIEMYHNFTQDSQKSRDFFIKYQDRILYGTDIGAKALLSDPSGGLDVLESGMRISLVRNFLEKDGGFRFEEGQGFLFGKFEGDFQSINLPINVLEKIYSKNFEKLTGLSPKPLNKSAILAELERLSIIIPAMGAAQPGMAVDTSVVEKVKSYFLSH
ncbi:MAG: hypothetical protein BGO78_05890 [Chloroflexi bacterium 44-23]|nr:MAG: hypothetical protein BGO78_05890 [Chloroflexi bacterium 44-23]